MSFHTFSYPHSVIFYIGRYYKRVLIIQARLTYLSEMLLVKTSVAPSPIEGMGLFAAEFIPKGTRIFQFIPQVDLRVSETEFQAISEASPVMKAWLWRYSFQNPKTNEWLICADDSRFTNHCENPNAISVSVPDSDELVDIAARDIREGEEITNDYRLFDTHPYHGMPKEELTELATASVTPSLKFS